MDDWARVVETYDYIRRFPWFVAKADAMNAVVSRLRLEAWAADLVPRAPSPDLPLHLEVPGASLGVGVAWAALEGRYRVYLFAHGDRNELEPREVPLGALTACVHEHLALARRSHSEGG